MSQDKKNQRMQGEAAEDTTSASRPRLVIKRDIGPKIAAKMKELRHKREQRFATSTPQNDQVTSPEGDQR